MERIAGVGRDEVIGRVAFEVFPFLEDETLTAARRLVSNLLEEAEKDHAVKREELFRRRDPAGTKTDPSG